MNDRVIVLAGATGDLGGRIGAALARRGAEVRAIVRPGTPAKARGRLEGQGITLVESGYDAVTLRAACEGAGCIVSALNGLEAVMLGQQGTLLEAAVAVGVPRFIPSDFSLDYTRTRPGENRNMDLRRRFRARLDAAPIRATSVLNGAFSTVLTEDAPILLPKIGRVMHWGEAGQVLDFTTKDDVADFTAEAALDAEAPRDLRIAGGSASAREIARLATEVSDWHYRTLRAGGIGRLGLAIRAARAFDRSGDAVFPAWQGMQYLRDMMSGRGQLDPLDKARYGKSDWTGIRAMIAEVV
ncbi:NmrA family NAD(P)-binding protein [Pseudoroseicyclus aestuarii]|uniref:Nucleoside-diphosphate-sugar epimerase n=1 Tax=Pseudoroseicyclus aestuarii TaxID=1795041 RepID=A0A318SN26_9RHOB|nr:NmrA family NAD(P)-binding protein [Pseudoroseicyclus aestuarii]PYE81363.1 nucleoside-diphosphate-sugar epimerase [Pseudoroseicyclus aestuarii]